MFRRDVGAIREVGVVAGCDAPEADTGGGVTARLAGADFDSADEVGTEV
jgi:hypothetical protein